MPRKRTSIRTLDPRRTLRQAAQKQQEGDTEAALELYLDVLDLDPAQPEALAGAVRLLTRQRRFDGAAELVEQSIDAGNQDPAAYVSLAELRLLLARADPWEPLVALGRLPGVKAAHFLRAADLYWQHGHRQEALATLHEAERRDPTHQPTLVKLAETYKMLLDKEQAKVYYQRTVDLGTRSEAGRAAEEFLTEVAPYIPRYVQTNMLYALREVLAVVVVYFLLALLDAGLNLLGIEAAGWLGVGLSLLGGYLLVTATSSPAQRIFQPFLGGSEQDDAPPGMNAAPALPTEVRAVLGVVGGVFLLLALGMVLRHSLVNAGATLETMRQGYIPDFVFDLCRQLPPWFCTF